MFRPLTRSCESVPAPELDEAEAVDETLTLVRLARQLGTFKLLHARINWRWLCAPSPDAAIEPSIPTALTYTRKARREQRQRQLQRRSGRAGLLRAIARVA
jgi:hypothetical protein